jgi:intracellular sulfur oxidation DsrE/DsrF family protein
MKVCETTMKFHGVERKDIPKFIDSVPYAPVEIENRLRDGYINL